MSHPTQPDDQKENEMSQWSRRVICAAISTVLLATTVGACSSSTKSSSSSPSETSSATSATSAIAAYLSPPTVLPVSAALTKAAPKNLKVIFLNNGVTQSATYLKGLQAAGASLGWSIQSQSYDPTNPATLTSSLQSAISTKPDAIVLGALVNQQFQAQLPQARANNIIMVSTVTSDSPLVGVYQVLTASAEQTYAAQILTKALLADATKSGKKAHVLEITVPAFSSVLGPEDAGVSSQLKADCPECTVSTINISLPDVFNGHYTAQVVSYLQRHPDINALVSDSGQLEDGLGAALQQAGLTSVARYGFSPSSVQIKELQAGQTGAWTAQPYQVGGWIIADEIARVKIGDPTNLWDSEHLAYLLTSTNVAGLDPADPEFPAGYQRAFQKMWGSS